MRKKETRAGTVRAWRRSENKRTGKEEKQSEGADRKEGQGVGRRTRRRKRPQGRHEKKTTITRTEVTKRKWTNVRVER